MKFPCTTSTYFDTIRCILFLLLLTSFPGCSDHIASSSDLALDHLMQGDADRSKGNYPAALQEYQTAASVSPNDWPGHDKAGQILEQEGRFQEAIVEYRKVIAINHALRNPAEKALWHFRLAHALSKVGLRQDAVGEYKLTVKIASQDQMHNPKLASLAKKAVSLSQQM